MVHELLALQLQADGILQLRVPGHLQLDGWEEVVDEGEEERLVLVHQLRQVHVSQHSHHNRGLRVVGVRPLHGPQGAQHGQDVSQAKVIVHLVDNRGRWSSCWSSCDNVSYISFCVCIFAQQERVI